MKIINSPAVYDLNIEGTIWDMDGTVFDTQGHQYAWLKFAYEKYSNSKDSFPKQNGSFWKKYNDAYDESGLEGIYLKIIKTDWHKNEKNIWKDFTEYNKKPIAPIMIDDVCMGDVIEDIYNIGVMTDLRKTRHQLAINTTKSYGDIKSSLLAADIRKCFSARTTYDDILEYLVDGQLKKEGLKINDLHLIRNSILKDSLKYLEKPHSLSSMLTFGRLGLEYNEAVIFEDTVTGIRSYKPVLFPRKSKNAYVVGVTWGFEKDPQKLIDAGADCIIEHPNEIIPFLESLGAFK